MDLAMATLDPLQLVALLWPDVVLYDKQIEIIDSVWDNKETIVPAGNMLGKDYVAGVVCLTFFLQSFMQGKRCRIVTTSIKDDHLRVLWGEIGRLTHECKYPLGDRSGGPLVLNQRDYRYAKEGPANYYSYMKGMVSEKGEGMTGHHAERTLLVIDEASGVDEMVYDQGRTWADKFLIFGNPNPCTNFFFRGVKAGNLKAETNGHYHRRVIKIKAEDSPNVRYARACAAKGIEPEADRIVPGVLTYDEYMSRRAMWDKIRQCIGLDAEFYEGAESLLCPPMWLDESEQMAMKLPVGRLRVNCTLGVDSAMGGDNTAWAVVDTLGLRHLESYKTPDTSVIVGKTVSLMREWNVEPKNVLFDAGGGGKVHADLIDKTHPGIRVIAFGAASTQERKRARSTIAQRVDQDEIRYAYVNRRAEMYGILRRRLDPAEATVTGRPIFALPAAMANRPRSDGGPSLRGQLAPIPYSLDGEGRMVLPPKNKKDPKSTKPTLTELIGCSPDEADAVVLALFGQEVKSTIPSVRVL